MEAIEALRRVLILDNPLGRKTGQLVHFAQLLAVGKTAPARLHARAARKAGASLAELAGVAELALITAGMPAEGAEAHPDEDAERGGREDRHRMLTGAQNGRGALMAPRWRR